MNPIQDGVNEMGQETFSRFRTIACFLALAFFASCKVDDPLLPTSAANASDAAEGSETTVGSSSSSGTTTVTAPIIADPLPGSTVDEAQPVLTVLNAAHEAPAAPTYLFQVATESSFTSLVAQSAQVLEGADGKTSWIVDRPLASGQYFWRARARVGTVDSGFSEVAELSLGSGTSSGPPTDPTPTPSPNPTPPPGGAFLYDPLVGGSVGEVSGGQFTPSGWRVTSPADYIRYEVPTLERGWVEFDTTGMREVNPSSDQFMLFGMWDPSAGPYRANPFRVHLQKLHPNPHNPPYLRVRWISQGEQHDEGSNFYAWNPSQKYHWRLDWGPAGDGHRMSVRLDGDTVIDFGYRRAYRPGVHWIELGIAERGESVVGVTYSDMQIGN